MTAKEFADKLKVLAPPRAFFTQKHLPEAFTNDFLDGYICKERIHRGEAIYTSNELLNLLRDYDCSRVSIGIIDFLLKAVETPDHYRFANADGDLAVVDKITLGVNVVDVLAPSHIIWKCASNGESFLQALLIAAAFLTERVMDGSLMFNDQAALKVATHCAEIAGGAQFVRFYKMLLGCNL